MEREICKHYCRLDKAGRIIYCYSDAFEIPADGDICFNEDGTRHVQIDGTYNPYLFTRDRIPLYKWDGAQVVKRSEEEMQLDRQALPPLPPTQQARINALEDALCEQDAAASQRMADIEMALCELDSTTTNGGI